MSKGTQRTQTNPQFTELKWTPHPERPDLGQFAAISFPNGWSATFLDGDFSIYTKPRVFEIQPWMPDGSYPDGVFDDWPYHGDAAEMQRIMDLIACQGGTG